MALLAVLLVLFLTAAGRCQEQAQTTDWRATLKTIRNGVHKIDMYLNAALDLLGGEDGLCQYKCSDGSKPFPRYGYKPSPPNGCGSPLFGVHLNIGIPSLTKCCNQHDRCYETCGKSKNDCDEAFQSCLSKICRDVQKTLGLAQHVQGEEQNMTEIDAFPRRFSDLGFEVKCFDDLRAEELLLKIHEASTASHVDADCFLCVFLSHGEGNHIYAYDAKIEIQTLTGLFKGDKCQSLVGKPKIFIIQACRGSQHDVPVIPLDAVDHGTDMLGANVTQVDAASVYTLPAGADFLMCYSVAEGYYSHRETVNGSWYIQDLCEMLGKFGSSLEFTELLTLVNRKVSQRRVDFCRDPSAIGKKQVPCFASMLTKKLHFSPKSK
uniref:Group XIIA secretory phospholipase A2 n=1 Tax=Capra hircus TaxID=9925 RepID=A0A8C2P4C8_CAPHI